MLIVPMVIENCHILCIKELDQCHVMNVEECSDKKLIQYLNCYGYTVNTNAPIPKECK